MAPTVKEIETDRRKYPRQQISKPALLQLLDRGELQSIPAEIRDIHRFGVCLEATEAEDIEASVGANGYLIQLDQHQVSAQLVWRAGSRYGFRFSNEFLEADTLSPETPAPGLRKFLLYVSGEDVDTGKYNYFPHTDKLVLDSKQILSRISKLRKGQYVEDLPEYFLAQYAVGDQVLSEKAVEAAHAAFLKFRDFSLERRCEIIHSIRERVYQEKEALIQLLISEGHPRKLAEWEFDGMVTGMSKKSIEYFRNEIFKTIDDDNGETLIAIRRPEGVICVFPPQNASCSNSLLAILALLVGNTLVIKPPFACPVSTIYLWRNIIADVLEKHGAPKGTVNIVLGNSSDFIEGWMENPHVKGVFFFSPSEMGLNIGKRLYEKGKKPILELAGNDFMTVWKDAPLDAATDSFLDGFLGSTQVCMVPKKAIIHADIYDQFVDLFLKKVRALKVGLPTDPDTILAPVGKITEFFEFLEDALTQGGTLLTGGHRINHLGEKSATGAYLEPTVIEVPEDSAENLKCVRQENFFPLLPLIKIDAEGGLSPRERDHAIFDKMRNLLEKNEYGLRISSWVRDPFYLAKTLATFSHSGMLRVNSRHVAFSSYISTHGGIGKTGGPFGEMNHVWQKTSHLQGISLTRLDTKN